MSGKRIDAGLRFIAETAEALRDIRALRAEYKRAKDESSASSAGTESQQVKAVAQERSRAAQEARSLNRATADSAKQAAREEAAAQLEAVRLRRAAEKQAAQERSLAEKEAARQRRAAEKAAAAEEDAARKARAKADREEKANAAAAAKIARQEQARLAQVAPQVTDIVTGLVSGQSPLMVAIQQGGQLRDVFGGFGKAAEALATIFTPMRLVIGGVVAVLGSFAAAAKAGYDEQQKLARGLAATGNTAATTAAQLQDMANRIANQQHVAIGTVKETLSALATSGQYSAQNLELAGRAVTVFARLTDQQADAVVASFGDMKGGVADWAARMNQSYNFLSAAQYEQIRAAEASGNKNEAVRLTLEALATTSEQRLAPALGLIERGWDRIKAAASRAWDSMKGVARDTGPEERLAELLERIESIRKRLSQSNPNATEQANALILGPLIAQAEDLRRQINDDGRKRADRVAAQAAENEAIRKQSAEYQAAVATMNAAEAARSLAQQQAALEKRAALVRRDHESGLISELEYNQSMNAIEKARLQAQAANVKRQIEIERGKATGSPEETMGRDARVTQLEAQLDELNGQIAAKTTDALTIRDAAMLDESRQAAGSWAATWSSADARIRQLIADNKAYASSQSQDAVERARQAVAAQLDDLQRQIEDERRGLRLQIGKPEITPGMRQELQRQLDDLDAQFKLRASAIIQKSSYDAFASRFAEEKAALDALLASIDASGVATVEAEDRKRQAIETTLPKLREYVALMKATAATPGEKNTAVSAGASVDALLKKVDNLKEIKANASQGLATMWTDIETGAKSAGDAVQSFIGNFAKSMLELINKRLADKLVDQAFKALDQMGSGSSGATSGGGFWATLGSMIGLWHTGGVVGHGLASMTRVVSPALFAGATRYHSGGIAGLAPDEVPAILKTGEEVLTQSDPRHRSNAGQTAAIGGDLNVSVQVSGASGSESSINASSQALVAMIKGVVVEWAAQESRPNGILSRKGG